MSLLSAATQKPCAALLKHPLEYFLLKIRELRTSEELQGLSNDWDRLLGARGEEVLASNFLWASRWWAHLGRNRELRVLIAEEGNQIVGIAPLCTETLYRRNLAPVKVRCFMATDYPIMAAFSPGMIGAGFALRSSVISRKTGIGTSCGFTTFPTRRVISNDCVRRVLSSGLRSTRAPVNHIGAFSSARRETFRSIRSHEEETFVTMSPSVKGVSTKLAGSK